VCEAMHCAGTESAWECNLPPEDLGACVHVGNIS
jgi:hypothetical protein